MEKLLLAILSLFVWPVGIILYFVYKDKRKDDAKLFLILGIVGLVFFGGFIFG